MVVVDTHDCVVCQLGETLNMHHRGESHLQMIIAMPTRCTVTHAKGRKNSMTWIRGGLGPSQMGQCAMLLCLLDSKILEHSALESLIRILETLLVLFLFIFFFFYPSTGFSIQPMHCSLTTLRSTMVKFCTAGASRRRGLRSSSLCPVRRSHTMALVSIKSMEWATFRFD